MIKFGEFFPDQSDLNNPGTTVATNVIPAATGYTSIQGLSPISGAADEKIVSMFAAKDDDGNFALYAADRTKIYRLDTTDSSLVSESKSGNYSTDVNDKWRFVQFGENVIATNFADPIQTKIAASGGLFADLSADAPKAKYIAVVRDFVFTGYTNDATDGNKPYRVRWSAINDHTSWAVDPTTQADFQDIADMGNVTGVVGGEYATILLEKGIVRGSYIGSPLIFQFDKVETNRGCKVPNSVCNVGHNVFYLSDDGFYMFDGQSSKAIGAEKVNKFFLDDFNSGFSQNMSASADPLNQIVVWSYPSRESINGTPDKLLIYSYTLDRWSTAEVVADSISPLYSSGYTLENLDNINSSIDSLPASLDSALYRGGEFFFAASKDKKVQSFTGDTLSATIETAEFEVSAGFNSVIRNIVPYVTIQQATSATVTAQVASRSRQVDTFTFGVESTLNADNFIPVRSGGRYHRVRIKISGGWKKAQGIDIEASKIGRR